MKVTIRYHEPIWRTTEFEAEVESLEDAVENVQDHLFNALNEAEGYGEVAIIDGDRVDEVEDEFDIEDGSGTPLYRSVKGVTREE